MRYILFGFSVFITFCKTNVNSIAINSKSINDTNLNIQKIDDTIQKTVYVKNDSLTESFKLGAGVIKFEFDNDTSKNTIEYFDSTLTNKFKINVENIFNSPLKKIQFAYKADYYLLVFSVSKVDSKYYEISGPGKKAKKFYIPISDLRFKFNSWENHIKHAFAIEFDIDKNPIRKLPSNVGKIIKLPPSAKEGYNYRAIEFRGEWMRIKWDDDNKHPVSGWIKWREKDNMLIELFYFA